MEPKQLANVLIKMTGLWLCVANINMVIGIVANWSWTLNAWLALVPFAVGLWLIISSQWFVQKLFYYDR